MCEKRFTKEWVDKGNYVYLQYYDNNEPIYEIDVVDILNEQHQKIKQLGIELEDMETYKNKHKEECKDYLELYTKLLHKINVKIQKFEEEINDTHNKKEKNILQSKLEILKELKE